MIKILLYLLSIDIKEGIEYIVSNSPLEVIPPQIDNDLTKSITENLHTLSNSIIKANPDWLKYKIVEVINNEDHTQLWYFSRIPYEYKYMINTKFHFIKLSMTENNKILRLKYMI
jgi:hypothetical protein